VREQQPDRSPDQSDIVPNLSGAEPGVTDAPARHADGVIRTGRLAGLSMRHAIWILAWPILIESFLNSFVGIVDTILAAGISVEATDAIGGASYIMWFLSMIGMAVGIGATALIARAVGGGKQAIANAALGQAMLLSTLSGVGVGAIVFAGTPLLARMLNLEGEASDAIIIYLRIAAIGVPFNAALLTGLACCRAAGDAVRPLWIMVVVNIVNIVASWALSGVPITSMQPGADGVAIEHVIIPDVFGIDLGILGIALGTLTAWVLGTVLVIALLIEGRPGIALKRRRLRPHWHTMRRLIRVGMPSFAEASGMWFGNFLILLLVGQLQGVARGQLGTHIIAVRVESLSFLPGFSMGMAASTLMGQYLGAGSPALAKRAGAACTRIGGALMGCMGLVFIFFPEQIIGIMSSQPEHLQTTPVLLALAGVIQLPFAVGLVLRTGMRGAGDTKVVMYITWTSTYLVRLPLAWYLSGIEVTFWDGFTLPNPGPHWGLIGIWMGLTGELVIRGAMFLIRFEQGGWARVKV
jgi:putative MATE family efflux protein